MSNPKVKYWISLISLGYMGGAIYLLPYVKYSFYSQMIEYIGCTNAQLGFMLTVFGLVCAAIMIPGGMLADKLDSRKCIIWSNAGITAVTVIHALTAHSYAIGLACWVGQAFCTGLVYWPGLQKFIFAMSEEGGTASTYGKYYFFNGLSGTIGNLLPIWMLKITGAGYPVVVWTMGAMTGLATILCALFLESESDMKARGIVFEEEDPIRLADLGYVFKWPGTYMFFLSEVFVYTLYAQISYLTPYLVDVMGIDPEASSLLSTIRTYAAMLLAPVGGYLASNVFKSTAKYQIVTFAIVGVIIAGIFMFNKDSNVTLVSVYTLIPSLLIMPCYSVKFSLIEECYIPQAVIGTSIGVVSLLPITDSLEPVLFGWWLDKYGNAGYNLIIGFLVVSCVIIVLNGLWVLSHKKKCEAGLRVHPRNAAKKAA